MIYQEPKRIILGASKGGISKTSTTIGIALNLALRGKRILLFDGDPEGNLTSLMSASYYRWHHKELKEPSTLMYAIAENNINDAVVKMSKNLFLIPSSMDFSSYPVYLIKKYWGKLKTAKEFLQVRISYLSNILHQVEKEVKPDYVFCDIPPSSDLFEKSFLYYVGSGKRPGALFLMMQTQESSYQGVQYFNDFAGKLYQQYHLNYDVAGVIPVLLQKQAPSDNHVLKNAIKNYGKSMMLTPIPFRERIKRYAITGISIPHTNPRDMHDRRITQMYTRITNEVLKRL